MERMIDDSLDCLSSAVQMNINVRADKLNESASRQISDHSMLDLGHSLAVETSELEGDCKETLRRILKAVHERSGCPIDRFCVSGSCGHQPPNASDNFGFDITVFVDCEVAHGYSSEHIACSIRSAETIYHAVREMVSACETDHYGIHFSLDDYNFHLAVTPSLGKKMHLQRKAVWDLIEEKDKAGKLSQSDLDMLSGSLHESLTSFMHMGDPVFHAVVRLSRLWRQNVLLNLGCGEFSTLAVVLVMMRCIEDEKARGMSIRGEPGKTDFPVKRVFKDFLIMLSDLDNQTITYQRFYEPDLIPERHMGAKPNILDPINPWRNVVHEMTKEGIEWVKLHAHKSLKTLDSSSGNIGELFMIESPTHRSRGL
jgi:hypothetical protein